MHITWLSINSQLIRMFFVYDNSLFDKYDNKTISKYNYETSRNARK